MNKLYGIVLYADVYIVRATDADHAVKVIHQALDDRDRLCWPKSDLLQRLTELSPEGEPGLVARFD